MYRVGTGFDHPLLVIAGFPRTGTTSIYRNLEVHPGFAVPHRKELNFFCQDELPALKLYARYFRLRNERQVCVDASPLYSLDSRVPARLRESVPHAKVILLVREPAGWLRSVYNQVCSYTLRPPPFLEFLKAPALRNGADLLHFSMRDGLYRRCIDAFVAAFGDNLMIIDFAAFERNPATILEQIEHFADANSYFDNHGVDTRAHNSSRKARSHPPIVRYLLSNHRLVSVASALAPASLLKRVQSKLYYAEGTLDTEVPPANEVDLEIAAATAIDRADYAKLFDDTSVLLGSAVHW